MVTTIIVVKLYILLFTALLSLSDPKSTPGHGREGYYFAENGEHRMADVYSTLARVLFDLRKGQSPEPTIFTQQELKANALARRFLSLSHIPGLRQELSSSILLALIHAPNPLGVVRWDGNL